MTSGFVVVAIAMLSVLLGQYKSHQIFERDQVFSIRILDEKDELALEKNILLRFSNQVFQWKTRRLQNSGVAHQHSGGKCEKVVDVHVTGSVALQVQRALLNNGLSFKILVQDLQSLIDNEKKENKAKKKIMREKRSYENDDKYFNLIEALLGFYPSYDELISWMHNLTTLFPQHVSMESLGKTFENRDVYLLKIRPNGTTRRPGFWIDAGTHAREWITISSSVFIITQLIKATIGQCSLTKDECDILTSFDWHIVPLINPDGYVFTHVDNRLWRKNRSKMKDNDDCVGVDLNRNFDVEWGRHYTSTNSCSYVYGGPYPGSENETISLMTYWTKNSNDLHAWLTLHSYGQFLMNRWSHVLINDTIEYNDTLSVMKKTASDIFNFSGYTYNAGSSPEVLYVFSGGSADWFRLKSETKHVYEMELRDNGTNHFILPLTEIIPTANEALISVINIANIVFNEYSSLAQSVLNTNIVLISVVITKLLVEGL